VSAAHARLIQIAAFAFSVFFGGQPVGGTLICVTVGGGGASPLCFPLLSANILSSICNLALQFGFPFLLGGIFLYSLRYVANFRCGCGTRPIEPIDITIVLMILNLPAGRSMGNRKSSAKRKKKVNC